MKHYKLLFTLFIIFLSTGCFNDELVADYIVYSNDFENESLDQIDNGRTITYRNSKVLGNFNNDGFTLHLNDLPDHNYLNISFDLLIHDSWDGNSNGLEPDLPDLWIMALNKDFPETEASKYRLEYSFSNGYCDNYFCLWQSFPNPFPFKARPKKGASSFGPGLCHYKSDNRGTSIYKINKTIHHKDKALVLDFFDQLYQTNSPDPKCDESWSLDNLEIRTLTIR